MLPTELLTRFIESPGNEIVAEHFPYHSETQRKRFQHLLNKGKVATLPKVPATDSAEFRLQASEIGQLAGSSLNLLTVVNDQGRRSITAFPGDGPRNSRAAVAIRNQESDGHLDAEDAAAKAEARA